MTNLTRQPGNIIYTTTPTKNSCQRATQQIPSECKRPGIRTSNTFQQKINKQKNNVKILINYVQTKINEPIRKQKKNSLFHIRKHTITSEHNTRCPDTQELTTCKIHQLPTIKTINTANESVRQK